MVMIIETILLIIGTIILITGNINKDILIIIFGTDKFVLPKRIVRVIGIFLLSPAPVAVIVPFLLSIYFGDLYKSSSQIFEIAYLFIVIILIILFSRRITKLLKYKNITPNESENKRTLINEISKPILLIGLTITSTISFLSIINLPFIVNKLYHTEVSNSRNNWDIIPYLILLPIIIIGILSTILLARVYNKMINEKTDRPTRGSS